MQGILYDITEKKITEEKLIYSEERFRKMFENAAVGISLVSLDGKWTMVNSALCKILGYSKEELLALNFLKLTIPEDIQISKDSFKILSDVKKDHIYLKKRYFHKNGYIIWVNLSISLVRDITGKPDYYIVITEDITDRKKIDEAKTQFVALTSHQLRTPPTAINWYSEMLLNNEAGVLNEKEIKYVTEIHNSNQRMINLINSFLSVSQLQLGSVKVVLAKTNLTKIVDDVLSEIQVPIQFKEINVIKKYKYTEPLIFNTDENLLKVVINNLISNSISYTPKKGRVSIKVYKDKLNNLRIEISDNGCGISEQAKLKIFSEFYRADEARLIKGEGSGLGLYITKSIVELLKGKIYFKSKIGEGTTFFVDIPGRGIVNNN